MILTKGKGPFPAENHWLWREMQRYSAREQYKGKKQLSHYRQSNNCPFPTGTWLGAETSGWRQVTGQRLQRQASGPGGEGHQRVHWRLWGTRPGRWINVPEDDPRLSLQTVLDSPQLSPEPCNRKCKRPLALWELSHLILWTRKLSLREITHVTRSSSAVVCWDQWFKPTSPGSAWYTLFLLGKSGG